MESVLEQGGTAFGSWITEENMTMGGKTGTSQVKRISMAERVSGADVRERPSMAFASSCLIHWICPTQKSGNMHAALLCRSWRWRISGRRADRA